MHWPPILSLCGIPMGVLSNPSSARLRPYLILFVLREITRHVVLSRSWHRMGEMQIKLSLHLINTRKHHAGENQQLLFISLWVQLSHHLVSGCQRKTEEQEKNNLWNVIRSVHAPVPHCHHNHTQRDKIPSYLFRAPFFLLSKDRNYFSDIRRFT